MNEYTISIEGYESGLTAGAVEQIFEDQLAGNGEVTVEKE